MKIILCLGIFASLISSLVGLIFMMQGRSVEGMTFFLVGMVGGFTLFWGLIQ